MLFLFWSWRRTGGWRERYCGSGCRAAATSSVPGEDRFQCTRKVFRDVSGQGSYVSKIWVISYISEQVFQTSAKSAIWVNSDNLSRLRHLSLTKGNYVCNWWNIEYDNMTSSKVCDCEGFDVVTPNTSGSSSGNTRALCESISNWTLL